MASSPQPAASPEYPRNIGRRAKYDAARQYVSAEELRQCLQDPRKAKTIRGPEFIVCLEDGELLMRITPAHLRLVHGIGSLAEYKAKPCATGLPRYNPSTPLVSESLHHKLSESARAAAHTRRMMADSPERVCAG